MFAYAIREYQDGGRLGRIEEKREQQDDQEQECNPTTLEEKHKVSVTESGTLLGWTRIFLRGHLSQRSRT